MLKKIIHAALSLLLTVTIVVSLAAIIPMTAKASTYVQILTNPTKTEYQVGEGFDRTGLNAVLYDNGNETNITDRITFFTKKKVELIQGKPFETVGKIYIDIMYDGYQVGACAITVTAASTSGTDQPSNASNWPFVPSDKNMTNGKVKSGWAYIISHDDGKFRVNEDNVVSPSFRYNKPFYFEHLGKDIYYIHAAYGGYLAYKGKVTDQSAQIIVSDTPCKWFLDAYNDGGVRKFALVAEENHKYVIRTWGYCSDKTDSKITLHNTLTGNVFMDDCKFFVSDWVDQNTIPQWWFDYKDGKPAPTGKVEEPEDDGYDYYGKLGFTKETELPITTNNIDYNLELPEFKNDFPTWGETVKNYLLSRNERGTILRAKADGEYVTITKYSVSGDELGSKELKYELPILGAVFCGKEYNYIAFGQNNTEEDDSKESIRIIKYDKEFNKISSVSVNGGQTKAIKPLDSTARFVENGNQLILHTARTRYKSKDGINHQSNLDIFVDTDQMKVTYVSSLLPKNHVSHSFDTYVRFDGKVPVFLDHGDAYPRSVFLQKASGSSYIGATMYAIEGPTGANYTGVTVGGFEVSKNSYLTAIATINQSAAKWKKNVKDVSSQEPTNVSSLNQRDIVVCILPRNFSNGDTAKTITIGKYIGTSKIASTPQLLKMSNSKFAVLWAEFTPDKINYDENDDVIPDCYVMQYINENGKKIGDPIQYNKANDFYTEYMNQLGK